MDPEVLDILDKAAEEEDCEEVNLDELKIGAVAGEFAAKLAKLKNLQDLTMNQCGLTALKGFPSTLPLTRLELNDNELDGRELEHLVGLKELQTLSLMNNKITEFSQLAALKQLDKLVQLDLSECPIAEKSEYRSQVFALLPQLQILDNKDADGNNFDYGDEEEGLDGELEGDEEFGDLEGEEEFADEEDEEYAEGEEDDEEEQGAHGKPTKFLKK